MLKSYGWWGGVVGWVYPSHTRASCAHTEELNVVSDKCNGRVLPSDHVCRNVKAFENSAQCFSQTTHSIVNGLRSLTFCDIFLKFMSINSFRHLDCLDKFYPIDNNPDDSIVISSANRSSRYFVPL